jgi:hypothetical protein
MSEKEKYDFAGAGDERAGPDRPGAEFYKLKNYCLLWIPDSKFVTGPKRNGRSLLASAFFVADYHELRDGDQGHRGKSSPGDGGIKCVLRHIMDDQDDAKDERHDQCGIKKPLVGFKRTHSVSV